MQCCQIVPRLQSGGVRGAQHLHCELAFPSPFQIGSISGPSGFQVFHFLFVVKLPMSIRMSHQNPTLLEQRKVFHLQTPVTSCSHCHCGGRGAEIQDTAEGKARELENCTPWRLENALLPSLQLGISWSSVHLSLGTCKRGVCQA